MVIQLNNMQEKIQVMKGKRKLTRTKVFIYDHLTREEKKVQIQTRKIMAEKKYKWKEGTHGIYEIDSRRRRDDMERNR